MKIALQIHPLPTHPMGVPAHQQVRSTQDILSVTTRLATSNAPEPHLLNHPPVFLRYDEGGEELLNRDCVKTQLGLNESSRTPIPGNLFVYIIEESKVNISTRVIRFLYGQLQILNYHKADANNVDLRKQAIKGLVSNGELQTSIARDIFDTSSLKTRHYNKLFAAANISDRTLRGLIRDASKKNSDTTQKSEKTAYKETTIKYENLQNYCDKKRKEILDSTTNTKIIKSITSENGVIGGTRKTNKPEPCWVGREVAAEQQISILFDEDE